ncbi:MULTISPECIES: co-chaperone YbbN [Lysinibacillus]|uniref:Thioredoxin n=1 Tax=Lysinibacillus antri TaxID=2498145 RepID=A0A3S0RTC0_9BACI|nr:MULTISPECIES: thioredoxin family protein [Lysinibacillus]RUL46520.1 thioredoxin [Lysinibacillus antri]TSI04001.1 thioredoxin family protein [Lysinibacillus sp. BW-2-10]
MKKLGIIGAVVIVLFIAIILLTNLSNKDKLTDNPYGTDNLRQSTIDLLDNENYQNIILPEALEEKIAAGGPVVAYMFSPECPHCMKMTPSLMPIADEVGVQVDQLNILEYDKGWNEYNIEATPTLIYFNEGKEVSRLVGDYSSNEQVIHDFLGQVTK